ncbi:MAG: hypothetical protein RLZZ455_544 [Candidatus Parcubacteria bacterium]
MIHMKLHGFFRFFRHLWMYALYIASFVLFTYVSYKKIGSFGCFDDCSNFVGAWFILKGQVLYEQIFFNHQPLAAYVSAAVQELTQPTSIYQLVVFHRVFVYLFSFVFGLLLLRRFGPVALVFLVLYEGTKFYFFGDRFLAEALIVYPLVYLLGTVFSGLRVKNTSLVDLTVCTFAVFFIFWMREPYAPVVLFLYGVYLITLKTMRLRLVSLVGFVLPSLCMFLLFPFNDFYFNVVTVNRSFHLKDPLSAIGVLSSYFYPVAVFFTGRMTSLRYFEMVLSLVFFILIFVSVTRKHAAILLGIVFVSLGLANLRPTPPGVGFYEAFHMLSWYALFLFCISYFLFMVQERVWLFRGISAVLFLSLLAFLGNPTSYLREKTDSQQLFYEGYNQYYTTGEVVRRLSTPQQTLFLDGWNDLIYWQADRTSPYVYSWYTSVMSGFPRYSTAREELLKNEPPDFFYGACKEWPFSIVTKSFISQYDRFVFSNKPTCLYVLKKNSAQFTDAQLKSIADLGYSL